MKLEPRATDNCLNASREYLYSMIVFGQHMLADPSKVLEAETEYNFNDIMLKLFNMCNILDTIIGTLVLNLMVWTLDQSDFTKDSFLRWVIKFIDFSSYLFDVIDMVDIG